MPKCPCVRVRVREYARTHALLYSFAHTHSSALSRLLSLSPLPSLLPPPSLSASSHLRILLSFAWVLKDALCLRLDGVTMNPCALLRLRLDGVLMRLDGLVINSLPLMPQPSPLSLASRSALVTLHAARARAFTLAGEVLLRKVTRLHNLNTVSSGACCQGCVARRRNPSVMMPS